jgi:uncharacterized protein YjbI with pentapeptide repeats
MEEDKESQRLTKRIKHFRPENPEIPTLIVVAIIILLFIFALNIIFGSLYKKCSVWENLFAAAHGFLAEVVVFGIIIVLITKRNERKADIKRWQEEIDDYRGWDEKEAMYRIVGNIRRLNKNGITNISLSRCFLKESDLRDANLQGAYLWYAILDRANLDRANLEGAYFHRANLQRADLTGAILQGASLRGANLGQAILRKANLQRADLWEANLQRGDFWEANLKGANFHEAILLGANLQEADITGVKYLTIEQLAEAKSLYKAKMDPELEKEVMEKYPHLLEKPKIEESPEGSDSEGR